MVFQHSPDAGKNFSFLSAEFPENVCAGGQRSGTPAGPVFDPPPTHRNRVPGLHGSPRIERCQPWPTWEAFNHHDALNRGLVASDRWAC